MSNINAQNGGYDLSRFINAQQRDFKTALAEIKSGQKRTHWIWYIFPQPTARRSYKKPVFNISVLCYSGYQGGESLSCRCISRR